MEREIKMQGVWGTVNLFLASESSDSECSGVLHLKKISQILLMHFMFFYMLTTMQISFLNKAHSRIEDTPCCNPRAILFLDIKSTLVSS